MCNVHENQTHWLRDDLLKFEDGIFKSLFIELKSNNFNIICGTLYHPAQFTDLMFSHENIPLINKPTRISTAMTLIDNIWMNNLKYLINSAIITDLISDHFAVLQCTEFPYYITSNPRKMYRRLNFKA